MKQSNNLLVILTLALAMVLIVACNKENGVTNGSEVPSDTTAIAKSSSGKADGSSGSTGKSSAKDTGTSSGKAEAGNSSKAENGSSGGSAESSSSSSVARSSSGCVEGDTTDAFGLLYICIDGKQVPQIPPKSSSSPYYDVDNVFTKSETNRAVYSEFTDPRDEQTYKTVVVRVSTVGDNSEYREYFAENLNYGTQVLLKEGQAQTPGTKYCYDDDSLHCKHHLGGLYTWSNAMGLPAACDTVAVGSAGCPKEGML